MIMIPPKPVNLDYEALVECLLEISCYIFLLSLNLPTKYIVYYVIIISKIL